MNLAHQVHQHPASVDLYIRHGWSLVPIPAGTKGPKMSGWNRREAALRSQADVPHGHGIGLAHAYSGTCALDIDDWVTASFMLGIQGVDIRALYDAPDAVIIDSGRPGRGKLLYALAEPLRTKKITTNGDTSYELRCATANGLTVQDVLPPSIHPETSQPYRWAGRGHWSRLPAIPAMLLQHWQFLLNEDEVSSVSGDIGTVDLSWSEIQQALSHIDPGCDRQTWINAGMALHWAGTQAGNLDTAFSMWVEWSMQDAAKFPGHREMFTQWKSFKSDGERCIKIGTLFAAAKEAGYVRSAPDVSHMFSEVAEPKKPPGEPRIHPLARIVPLEREGKPTKWVIRDVIQEGFVIIAGSPGVGKTTNLLPLLAHVAHLGPADHPMRPPARRKIIWITEDAAQVQRIIHGMVHAGWFTLEEADGWFNVVNAARMPADQIAQVEEYYREYANDVEGACGTVTLKPLIVIDTLSAVVDLVEENSNIEVSKAIATLKTAFAGYPLVVLAHTSKALKGRVEARELAIRGAGALEADAHQVLFLLEDAGDRFMVFGKTRFERKEPKEIRFEGHFKTITLQGDFGPEESVLRWSVAEFVSPEERVKIREEAKQNHREESAAQILERIKAQMLEVIRAHCDAGEPVGRTQLYKEVTGKTEVKPPLLSDLIRLNHVVEYDGSDGKKRLYALSSNERFNAVVRGNVISATVEGIDKLDPPE